MHSILSLTQYQEIVLLLSRTPAGREIAEGKSRVYPARRFLSDMQNAGQMLGLEYISLVRIANYAELLSPRASGRSALSINEAIGRTCHNLIRLGKLRIRLPDDAHLGNDGRDMGTSE